MLNIDVRHNISDVSNQLKSLSGTLQTKAISRALNKTAQQGRTAAAREIRAEYKVKARDVNKAITIRRAGKELVSRLMVEGKPLPLMAFSPRQTKAGVRVKIKGRNVVIPHAFIATMKSGHQGVFARGGYKGSFKRSGKSFGRFAFGSRRLPIGEFMTFSIPQSFNNPKVQEKVVARIQEQFPKVLLQEINYLNLK